MIAVLVFAVSSLAIFWPVLFGGQIIVNHYASQVHYPIFSYVSGALQSTNSIPLWIDAYLSGFPAYLSQQGFLYPVAILFLKLFDFLTAYHWLTFLNFSLAGFFMYILARNLSLSKAASFVAGAAYAFSRINIFLGGQMPVFSNFYPLVPLIFLSVLKISRGKKIYIWIGGLVVGLAWIAGFTEAVFYAVVSAFFFALFLDSSSVIRLFAFFARPGEASEGMSPSLVSQGETPCPLGLQTRKKVITELFANFKATKWCIAIGIISLILASPWLLPTMNFVNLTNREGGVAFDEIAGSYPSLIKYLYSSVFPFLNTGSEGINSFVFIGLLVYLLAFFSFFVIRRNKFLPYFIGLFIFTFLVFFKPSQVFELLHRLPIFNFFYGSWKWAFMSNFALALLAGFGLEYLSEAKEKVNFKIFTRFLEICGLLFLIFVLVAAVLSLKFVNYKFFISALFIIASFSLFSLYQRGYFDFLKFQKLAAAVLILNFVLGWQGVFDFMPKDEYLSAPETILFIKSKGGMGDFRAIKSALSEKYAMILENDKRELLKYNLATGNSNHHILYNVASASGNEAFSARRHHKLTNAKELFQNSVLLSMLNVKYVLSSFELPPPLKKVFETAATRYNIPVYVYENPDVLPRVYFAKKAVYSKETNEEKLFNELLEIDNFKEKTLIECFEPLCLVDYQISSRSPSAGSQIIVEELKNGYLKLKTKTTNPRWLVYSESNLPTWEARLKPISNFQFFPRSGIPPSGTIFNENTEWRPLKIYTANYIYQAVFVPEGEHEIEFKYPGVFKQMEYAILNLLW